MDLPSVAEVGNCLGHDVERLLGIDSHQDLTIAIFDLAKIAFVNHRHAVTMILPVRQIVAGQRG